MIWLVAAEETYLFSRNFQEFFSRKQCLKYFLKALLKKLSVWKVGYFFLKRNKAWNHLKSSIQRKKLTNAISSFNRFWKLEKACKFLLKKCFHGCPFSRNIFEKNIFKYNELFQIFWHRQYTALTAIGFIQRVTIPFWKL